MSTDEQVGLIGTDCNGRTVSVMLNVTDVSLFQDGLLVLRMRLEDDLRLADKWGYSDAERENEADYKQVSKLVEQLGQFLHDLEEGAEPYRCQICGQIGGH